LTEADDPNGPQYRVPLSRWQLLNQRDKARRIMHDFDLPWDLRMLAKSVFDKADVSLGLRDAMARKLGSMAAVDAAIAALPDPTHVSPYPPIARTDHKD
jgi:hypothetical protein